MAKFTAVKQFLGALTGILKPNSKHTRREQQRPENINRPSTDPDEIPRAYHVEDENDPGGPELARMRTPVLVRH